MSLFPQGEAQLSFSVNSFQHLTVIKFTISEIQKCFCIISYLCTSLVFNSLNYFSCLLLVLPDGNISSQRKENWIFHSLQTWLGSFPGGSIPKALSSQCRGHWFAPCSGNYFLYVATKSGHCQTINKYILKM